MKRILAILCYAILIGGLLRFFPLFHIVRNEASESAKQQTDFDAVDFVHTFWTTKLLPALNQAPDAAAFFTARATNPQTAREQFGRKIGVSRVSLYLLRGSGTIVRVDKSGVGVALQKDEKEPAILLRTGFLFGNTIRDAAGLLDTRDFPDSRQFNEISAELNRIAEAQVLPTLKDKAVVGRHIEFAGCAEISDDATDIRPLPVIPLDVRIE